MSAKWVSVFLSVGGFVLAVLGLLLPWAERSVTGRLGGGIPVLGIDTHVGAFSVIGLLVAVLSWVLVMARKPKPLLAFAAGGGIWIMYCASAWIVSPGTLFGAFLSSAAVYRASYGAYVSLVGGALTFAGAALALCQSSLPSVPPGLKSSLRRRRLGIVAFVVGLSVGLALGVFSGVVLLPTHTGPSWKSAVLVSGTTSETQNGTIHIDSMDMDHTVSTETNITDGEYSALLVGGLYYFFDIQPYGSQKIYEHILYVPSNVTAFTANF
jgi:hypothetical protein